MNPPIPGQRWVSDSEPELGLGIVMKVEFGRVELHFPAANEQRQYALKSAPLRRVAFAEGDKIKLHSGEEMLVVAVEERAGLLTYRGAARSVAEAELSDTISFSQPEERLLVGQVDDLHTFDLRTEALRRRSENRQSPVRGFVPSRSQSGALGAQAATAEVLLRGRGPEPRRQTPTSEAQLPSASACRSPQLRHESEKPCVSQLEDKSPARIRPAA